jgi:hypothetical protein
MLKNNNKVAAGGQLEFSKQAMYQKTSAQDYRRFSGTSWSQANSTIPTVPFCPDITSESWKHLILTESPTEIHLLHNS